MSPPYSLSRVSALQAKNKEQDVEPYATRMSCSKHQVTYYRPASSTLGCPVCKLEDRVGALDRDNTTLRNKLEMVTGELNRLKPQLDLTSAIRSALEIMGDDDFQWLKAQMYQYREDKSVSLKVTHGRPASAKRKIKRGEALPANGFIAMRRNDEPEGYACTSLGGLAIAGYFDEACATVGSAQAMGLLLKAMWKTLPGARS